jgi:hypothetical protein
MPGTGSIDHVGIGVPESLSNGLPRCHILPSLARRGRALEVELTDDQIRRLDARSAR